VVRRPWLTESQCEPWRCPSAVLRRGRQISTANTHHHPVVVGYVEEAAVQWGAKGAVGGGTAAAPPTALPRGANRTALSSGEKEIQDALVVAPLIQVVYEQARDNSGWCGNVFRLWQASAQGEVMSHRSWWQAGWVVRPFRVPNAKPIVT